MARKERKEHKVARVAKDCQVFKEPREQSVLKEDKDFRVFQRVKKV